MVVRSDLPGIDPPLAGHAEVEDERVAPIGIDQPIFGPPAEPYHLRTRQPLAKIGREGVTQIRPPRLDRHQPQPLRSEEHTSELQSLMRISYAVFCLQKKQKRKNTNTN